MLAPKLVHRILSLCSIGTAIYVFFILANNAGPGITSTTECDFIMDNYAPVHFSHSPDMSKTDLLYNQLVYRRTGLPLGQHRLEISDEGNIGSYIDFDYAIYTCVMHLLELGTIHSDSKQI